MIRKLLIITSFFYVSSIYPLFVSNEDAALIGQKIWENECNATIKGLTTWNKNENFPSLGIGHFIWYPKDKKEKFEETFPSVLIFLEDNNIHLPGWLKKAKGCPWKNYTEFYDNFDSEKMNDLRQLLFNTKDLQAIFIAKRLENAFLKIHKVLTNENKDKVTKTFQRLSNSAQGLYGLIDYLNFKGSGISLKETYNGQGWGLLQVLENMPSYIKDDPVLYFVNSAKYILQKRVDNSPKDKNENRWLKGWFNRLDTYLEK